MPNDRSRSPISTPFRDEWIRSAKRLGAPTNIPSTPTSYESNNPRAARRELVVCCMGILSQPVCAYHCFRADIHRPAVLAEHIRVSPPPCPLGQTFAVLSARGSGQRSCPDCGCGTLTRRRATSTSARRFTGSAAPGRSAYPSRGAARATHRSASMPSSATCGRALCHTLTRATLLRCWGNAGFPGHASSCAIVCRTSARPAATTSDLRLRSRVSTPFASMTSATGWLRSHSLQGFSPTRYRTGSVTRNSRPLTRFMCTSTRATTSTNPAAYCAVCQWPVVTLMSDRILPLAL